MYRTVLLKKQPASYLITYRKTETETYKNNPRFNGGYLGWRYKNFLSRTL